MGAEFWGKGTNIQEGPGLNIARIERNGRTFEYLSGEDPVLGKNALFLVSSCSPGLDMVMKTQWCRHETHETRGGGGGVCSWDLCGF
jgi:hypothetical protein